MLSGYVNPTGNVRVRSLIIYYTPFTKNYGIRDCIPLLLIQFKLI